MPRMSEIERDHLPLNTGSSGISVKFEALEIPQQGSQMVSLRAEWIGFARYFPNRTL